MRAEISRGVNVANLSFTAATVAFATRILTATIRVRQRDKEIPLVPGGTSWGILS